MAGDWIKMRVDLGDDPAVVQIAARLDTTEDEVVGKLHRLWSWADKHTTDGTAPAITGRWVDRYVGCSGFADAMSSAGWISFSDAGVLFPSFDRHNGESAKRRGEAAIRQRLSRQNRDEGVTGEARSPIPRPFVRHVMERDAYTCVYCGEESSAAKEASRKAILSVDHIKPITRGGSAAVENLACCCRQCNGEKSDRTPEEWNMLPTFLQAGVVYKNGQLVADASQKTRDAGVTREEKRREEKRTTSPSEVEGAKRATRKCPDSFAITEDLQAWAATEAPGVDLIRETAKFRDHTFKTAHSDWPGAWRNWIRRSAENVTTTRRTGETDWQRSARERVEQFAPGVAARAPGQTRPLTFIEEIQDVPAIASR